MFNFWVHYLIKKLPATESRLKFNKSMRNVTFTFKELIPLEVP